jgi:hypothetical protein
MDEHASSTVAVSERAALALSKFNQCEMWNQQSGMQWNEHA